jgi:Rrf2 family protein
MISKKTIYGLQAVILLAKRYDSGPVLITDLAREGHIPKKFLEAILLELRKNGILNSKKGKGGGYVLGKDPRDISVGDIIRTLDGSFSEVYFEDETKETNEIKMIMKEVRDAMSNILDKTSLADVIERASIGQNVLNYVI